MASTYLTRAFSGSTSTTKATWSFWVKFSAINIGVSDTGSMLFQARNSSSSNNFRTYIRYEENGTLDFICYNATGTKIGEYYTSKKFRDCNAWYHICYSMDTTLSTASDRLKLYVNGVRETSFDTGSYTEIGQNETVKTTSSVFTDISRNGGSAGYYFNGILSHYILTDGYVYQADTFGSTDTTTGEWKINPSPTISNWGSNGFWILKDGNSVTDSSPNSNTFTVGAGTLTKTEDCPSNVFCTINPLNSYWAAGTFTYGNNAVVLPNKSGAWNTGTLGMTSGKYYWEIKCTGTSNGAELQLGIADKSPKGNTGSGVAGTAFGINSNGEYGIYAYNGAFIGNGVANPYTSWGSATTNGIAMIAVDLDNNKFYGGVNGTWFASGNPATGANGKTIQAVADTVDGCYYPAVGTFQGYDGKVECNFGNGYFADNAVSSAGSNASGNGIFEYDVPTGYTALSTKGLNL